jgi:demethylmenaquinone methyltransferase / 2-methoxy-6-polyprenyl-1,4-benzoquinol methylase
VSVQTGRLAPDAVRSMFDRIAPLYDAMNVVMTAGLDGGWRVATARGVVRPGDRVLDVCCGTGDLALAALARGGRVTAVDFSERMLERARRKSEQIEWLRGDALALPFPDEAFDAVTIGFGLRNVEDADRGLRELRRVLRPGGRVGVLDVTQPRGLLRHFYALWFDRLIPLLGRAIPGGAAYRYLPASVRRFPTAPALARSLLEAGFADVRYRRFAGGIVALHTGTAA